MAETLEKFGAAIFPRVGKTYTVPPAKSSDGGDRVAAVQTIAALPREVFALYTRVELLPSWQEGVISVTQASGERLHWKTEDPGTGKVFEFDTTVLESTAGKKHVCRIVDGPLAGSTDTVTFEEHPSGRGTVVRWVRDVKARGGWVTKAVSAVISRSPQMVVAENLRHLKAMVESGEIPTVEGQPAGPRGAVGWVKRVLLGETMPTPPGTSDRARPEDMPKGKADPRLKMVGVAALVAVGVAAALTVGRGDRR